MDRRMGYHFVDLTFTIVKIMRFYFDGCDSRYITIKATSPATRKNVEILIPKTDRREAKKGVYGTRGEVYPDGGMRQG